MKVALIGGGPCGLAFMHSMRTKEKEGVDIPEIVCFEKQADVGGLWNYTWRTGLDQHGEPVHNSMYRYLWSNGPKECLEFSDYSFFEHYGKPIPSFPPRMILKDYIMGRVRKSGVLDNSSKKIELKFNTVVKDVTYNNDKFTIQSFDSINKVTSSADFDYLVVASGHFSYPNMPTFPGLDTFNGRILHAHDFRDAIAYKGDNILLIGASYSAEDIGLQLAKYGAKKVTISYRTSPMGFHWPDNIEELPLLTGVNEHTVSFPDGVTREIDTIIMCTGYQMKHSFLPDSLRLQTPNILYPDRLYKGVVWNDNPKCLYLGMQDQYYTYTMFDVQAWYARDVILQKIQLPSHDERTKDIKKWFDRGAALNDCYEDIAFQRDYIKDIEQFSDYPRQDHDQVARHFDEWEHHKHEDILTYREKCFKSVVSGHMAPVHHTKWFHALDDSMEAFMNVKS